VHSPEDEDVIVDASNMNFMHVPAEAVMGTSLGFPCGEHWSWLIHVEIPNYKSTKQTHHWYGYNCTRNIYLVLL
jgi:hypothetical protein